MQRGCRVVAKADLRHRPTPQPMLTRIRAAVLTAGWWLAQPFAEARYYQQELQRGAYPPDADSIAIPIARFVFGWLIVSPPSVWTIALALFALSELWFVVRSIPGGYAVDIVTSLGGAVAALAARAALCARRPPEVQPARAADGVHGL